MKSLQYFNLLGVVCLGILCLAQWRRDSEQSAEIQRLHREGAAHAEHLQEELATFQGTHADLQEMKRLHDLAARDRDSLRERLRLAQRDLQQSRHENETCTRTLTNWMGAVSVRDEKLQEAIVRLKRLGQELETATSKYNHLASNYNVAVRELKDFRAREGKSPAPSPSSQ